MLYNEARPRTFSEFVGNSGVVSSLKAGVQSGDVPHTMMFIGPSGCGKTTLARILASSLGSSSGDIVEANAANTTGIDSVRELAIIAQHGTLTGKPRFFIIDESHQLSTAAQQGFLKTVEDCGKNVYFAFCTTDPSKMLLTLRNRCAKYELSVLKDTEIRKLLQQVVKQGLVTTTLEAEEAIVLHCNGCPRTALTMAEQTEGMSDLDEILAVVNKEAELEKQYIDLCRAIVGETDQQTRWKNVLACYKATKGVEAESARRCILGYLKSCLLGSVSIKRAERFADLLAVFEDNCYDSGEAGLVAMLFWACFN